MSYCFAIILGNSYFTSAISVQLFLLTVPPTHLAESTSERR